MDVPSGVVDSVEGPLSSEESEIDVHPEDSRDFRDVDSSGESDDDDSPSPPSRERREGTEELPRHRVPAPRPRKPMRSRRAAKKDGEKRKGAKFVSSALTLLTRTGREDASSPPPSAATDAEDELSHHSSIPDSPRRVVPVSKVSKGNKRVRKG